MKRFLVVLTIICSLSLPVFAGHHQMGSGAYCNCEPVQNICPCCGGFLGAAYSQENDSISQHDLDGAELGIVRLAILTWLKMRA
jgi:hypothetical protein